MGIAFNSELIYVVRMYLVAESIKPMDNLVIEMEEAGKSIMQKRPVNNVGVSLIKCGDYMETLSVQIKGYAPKKHVILVNEWRLPLNA